MFIAKLPTKPQSKLKMWSTLAVLLLLITLCGFGCRCMQYFDLVDVKMNQVSEHGVLYINSDDLDAVQDTSNFVPDKNPIFQKVFFFCGILTKKCGKAFDRVTNLFPLNTSYIVGGVEKSFSWLNSFPNKTDIILYSGYPDGHEVLDTLNQPGFQTALGTNTNFFQEFVEILGEIERRNVTINYTILNIDIDKYIYDFDGAKRHLDKVFVQYASAVEGLRTNLILRFTNWKINSTEKQNSLKLFYKFAYYWGEMANASVMMLVVHLKNSSAESKNLFTQFSNSFFLGRLYLNEYSEMHSSQNISQLRNFHALCSEYDEVLVQVNVYKHNPEALKNITEQLLNVKTANFCQLGVLILVVFESDKLYDVVRLANGLKEIQIPIMTSIKSVLFDLSYLGCQKIEQDDESLEKILMQTKNILNKSGIRVGVVECKPHLSIFNHLMDKSTKFLPTNVAKIVDDIKIRHEFWIGYNQDLDDVPELLHKLHSRIVKEYGSSKRIITEGHWSASDVPKRQNELNCYRFKRYWNILLSWANMYNFFFVPNENSFSFRETERGFGVREGGLWFKNLSLVHSHASKFTDEEQKFLSSFRDTCIILDEFAPSKYLSWSGFVGVTFSLISPVYETLSENQLSDILHLINFRFNVTELILHDATSFNLILKSIQKFTTSLPADRISKVQYYISIGQVLTSADETHLAGHLNLGSNTIKGIHFNLEETYKDDFLINFKSHQKILKRIGVKVGVVVEHKSQPAIFSSLEQILIKSSHYVIMNTNIAKILASLKFQKGVSQVLENDIYFMISRHFSTRRSNKQFYELFDGFRAFRLNCKRLNPNITVLIRIGWPTVEEKPFMDKYLTVWKFVDEFSRVFDFPVLVNEAFDLESKKITYGWWKLDNPLNLSNMSAFTERKAEYLGAKTLRPEKLDRAATLDSSFPKELYSILPISILAVVILLIAIFWVRRYSKIISNQELLEFERGASTDNDQHIFGIEYNRRKYEIRKEDFNPVSSGVSTLIGVGNFGVVYKANIVGFFGNVAVKLPKSSVGRSELAYETKSLLREIKIMNYVGEHENVLTLLGACTKELQKGVVFVVFEYCANGSLLHYLRGLTLSTGKEGLYNLFRFCEEISNGMSFLREKRVIHGDLSARNILLNDCLVCKISDFGLSRHLNKYELYTNKTDQCLPWAWMALESLSRLEFSLNSDVWSMGVTFWEIFTLGDQPYSGQKCTPEFKDMLANGMRLEKPELCSNVIFAQINRCWETDPTLRPNPEFYQNLFRDLKGKTYASV